MKVILNTTKSKTYFLPLFSKYVNIEYFPNLVNTYFWYDQDISEETFCLLFKFDGKVYGTGNNKRGFTLYEDYLKSSELFVGYEDYNEYVVYKFQLNPDLVEKRDTLLKGQYSKLSEEDKKDIIDFTLAFYDLTGATMLRKILYKDPKLRVKLAEALGYRDLPEDSELSSAFELKEEVFQNALEE